MCLRKTHQLWQSATVCLRKTHQLWQSDAIQQKRNSSYRDCTFRQRQKLERVIRNVTGHCLQHVRPREARSCQLGHQNPVVLRLVHLQSASHTVCVRDAELDHLLDNLIPIHTWKTSDHHITYITVLADSAAVHHLLSVCSVSLAR